MSSLEQDQERSKSSSGERIAGSSRVVNERLLQRERGFAIVQDAAHAGTRWAADLGVGRALAGAKVAKVAKAAIDGRGRS